MNGFGFSAGDIAMAIQILWRIMKAFDRAKGAKKQYALSCGFLRQLIPVVKRMEMQLKVSHEDELQSDLAEQFEAISVAYEDFDNYLAKRYNGLSAKEPNKAHHILSTIRWALDELNDKVQKFKDRVNDALQVYQARMLQEIFNKVDSLESTVQSNSSEDQTRFEETTAAMKAVQEQLMMYQEFEKDTLEYKKYLSEDIKQQQTQDTSSIRGDLAEMRTEMKANHNEQMRVAEAEAESQEESRSQLMQCQKDIMVLIERQQQMAKSQDEEAKWNQIQMQAQEEAQANESAQKAFTDNLQNTSEGLTLVNDKVGNEHVRKGLDEVNYVTKWAGFLGKTGFLTTKGGSGKKDPQPSASTRPKQTTAPARYRPTTVFPPPSTQQRLKAPANSSGLPASIDRSNFSPPPPPRSPVIDVRRFAMPPPPSRNVAAQSPSLSNPWRIPTQPSTSVPSNPDPRRDSALGSPEPEVRPPLPARPKSESRIAPQLPSRTKLEAPPSPPKVNRSPEAPPPRSPPALKPKPRALTATLPTQSSSVSGTILSQAPMPGGLQRTITSPAMSVASDLKTIDQKKLPGVTSLPYSAPRMEGYVFPSTISNYSAASQNSGSKASQGDSGNTSVRQRAMLFER